MPFSWKKKTKRNRFSQLVADHLQSPKRGGSLVVETGFPTSLIDLYVRNRGRFRKGKKFRDEDSPLSPLSPSSPSSPSSGLIVDSDNLCSSLSLDPMVDSNMVSCGGLDGRESDEIVEEDVVVGARMVLSETEINNSIQNEREVSVEMAKLNPVLVVVLKVLFVVLLVLGTKRFTVGITVSAFVLLLLELVVKVFLQRSESVSKSSVYITENIESLEENATREGCSEVLEIEEEVGSKQDVRSEKELDEVRSEEFSMEIKRKSSRRAVMKLKMKKLVPKKLRKSSAGSKEEISYRIIEEETKSAQDDKTLVLSSECSDSLKGETLRILKRNQDKIVEIEGGSYSLSSALSSEIDCNDKELGKGLRKDSGCLVLCLVVLVGLIGGRFLALVLALSWCLMLKKLQWRNVKFPIS